MTVLEGVARLALVLMWLASGSAKLRDRAGFRAAVVDFGVSSAAARLAVVGVPTVELLCAVLLVLPDPAASAGAVLSLLLLIAFSALVIVNLLKGSRPSCHCFGELSGTGGISWMTVGRNTGLLLIAATCLIGTGGLKSLPGIFLDLSTAGRWVLASGLVVTAVLVALGLALWTLIGRYGQALLRLETLERIVGIAEQPVVPAFALRDLDGTLVTLDGVLAKGRPALLVFISPSCAHCAELLPDMVRWQSDPEHPVEVVVLSSGTAADNRDKLDGLSLRVLLRDDTATMADYGIQGTPGAILVDTDRRRLAEPALGPGGVHDLHSALAETSPSDPHESAGHPSRVGEELPELVVETGMGSPMRLGLATMDGVLLFWRVDCGFCAQILPEVRDLQMEVPMQLVTTSTRADLDESGMLAPLLRDPEGALQAWLGAPGTPSAVWVRAGRVDSELAVGGPQVLNLLRSPVSVARG